MGGAGTDEFVLALRTGMSLAEVRAMPNTDFEAWQDFFAARRAWQEIGRDFG